MGAALLQMNCCWMVLTSILVANMYVGDAEGARILALFSYNSRSHFSMFQALLRAAAARGHQVYVVGHFPQKHPVPNYTDLSVKGTLPDVVNNLTVEFVRDWGYFNVLKFMLQDNLEFCQKVMDHPDVRSLSSGSHSFDLIITQIFGPDCFTGFSQMFKAPVVSLVSSVIVPWGNDRIGNPDHPAYIPNYFLPFGKHMNFAQRVVNTLFNEVVKHAHYFFSELPMDAVGRAYFDENLPPLSELKKRTSLILVNSHFSLNIPRPVVPGLVEVSGLHIASGGQLPEELDQLMNAAEHGVVYFSLGSMVRSETLPREKLDAFVQVFGTLPQLVLWKTNGIAGLPPNVKTSTWFPQFEILSHANVRVFITHGGFLGTQEAVYAGVPMVGIPLFADQDLNIETYVTRGTAVRVRYEDISGESLAAALNTVLHDSSYRENAKHLSHLFRDRPNTALDTAIFWTEYVIKHGGAPHMRSSAARLPWYQRLMLDVSALTLLIIISVFSIVYYVMKGKIKTE